MNKNLKALENLVLSLNELNFGKGFNQENFEVEKFFFKMLKLYIERCVKEHIPQEVRFSIEVSSKIYLHHGFRKILIEDFSSVNQKEKLSEISEKKDILVKKIEDELEAYVTQYKEFKRIVDSVFFKLKKEYYQRMKINYPLFSNEKTLSENFILNMYDFGEGFSLELNVANHVGVGIENIKKDSHLFSYNTPLDDLEDSIRDKLESISIELKNTARSHVKVELKSYLVNNYPDISYEFRRKFLFVEDCTEKRLNERQFPVDVLISKGDLPAVSKSIHNYFKLLQDEMAKEFFVGFSVQNVKKFDFKKGFIPLNLTDESLDFALKWASNFKNKV